MLRFLGNNEKEKMRFEVKKRTVSLWSYVNNPEILRSFVNALYEPNVAVLWPCVAPQSIVTFLLFVLSNFFNLFKLVTIRSEKELLLAVH